MDINSANRFDKISNFKSNRTDKIKKFSAFAGAEIGQIQKTNNNKSMGRAPSVELHELHNAEATGKTSEAKESTPAQGTFGNFEISQGSGSKPAIGTEGNVSDNSLGNRIASNG